MNLHLILISVLEGLTEFLPISSTAHLIIISKLMSVDLTDAYVKFYLLFIQLGALLAGILLFSKSVLGNKKNFINIVISFVPTAVLGLVFYKLFKHLLEGNFVLMALMLFVGGIIFIYIEKKYLKTKEVSAKSEITHTDAFIIGVVQAIAIIPGVSRSGATIVAGIFRNIEKRVIIEYTFLLALPTLGAAVVYDFYKSREVFAQITSYSELTCGFAVAFVVGYATLFFLKKYLPKISLTWFGYYRIALALVILIVLS